MEGLCFSWAHMVLRPSPGLHAECWCGWLKNNMQQHLSVYSYPFRFPIGCSASWGDQETFPNAFHPLKSPGPPDSPQTTMHKWGPKSETSGPTHDINYCLCNSNSCQHFQHLPSPSAICRAVMLRARASVSSEAENLVSGTLLAY